MGKSFAEEIANEISYNTHLNTLQELPRQFLIEEDYRALKKLLGDYDFIRLKLQYLGIQELLGDYERARPFITAFYFSPLASALRRVQNILLAEPEQLPSQLWIQLSQYQERDERLRRLLAQIQNSPNPWLKPSSEEVLSAEEKLYMPIHTQHQEPLATVAMSGDGRWAATTDGNDSFIVWELPTTRAHATYKVQHFATPRAHYQNRTYIKALALSQDGSFALSATQLILQERQVILEVWNLKSDSQSSYDHFNCNADVVSTLAISADGKLALIGFGDDVMIWLPGERIQTYGKGLTPISTTLPRVSEFPLNMYTSSIALSPDGCWAATRSGNLLILWDIIRASIKWHMPLKNNSIEVMSLNAAGELCIRTEHNKFWIVETSINRGENFLDIKESVVSLMINQQRSYLDSWSVRDDLIQHTLVLIYKRSWVGIALKVKAIQIIFAYVVYLVSTLLSKFNSNVYPLRHQDLSQLWQRLSILYEFNFSNYKALNYSNLKTLRVVNTNARVGLCFDENSNVFNFVDLQLSNVKSQDEEYPSLKNKEIFALTSTGKCIAKLDDEELLLYAKSPSEKPKNLKRISELDSHNSEIVEVAVSINLRYVIYIYSDDKYRNYDRIRWLHWQPYVYLRSVSRDGKLAVFQDRSGTIFIDPLPVKKESNILKSFSGFDGYIGYGRLYPVVDSFDYGFRDPLQKDIHSHLVFSESYADAEASEQDIRLIRSLVCISYEARYAVFYSLDANIDYFWLCREPERLKNLLNISTGSLWAARNPENKILIVDLTNGQQKSRVYCLPDSQCIVRFALAFSNSDYMLLCCKFGTVYRLNLNNNSVTRLITAYDGIIDLALSPDDLWLAVMTYDAKITIWHQPTATRVAALSLSKWLYTARFVKKSDLEYEVIAVDEDLKLRTFCFLVRTSTEFGRRSTEPSEIAISLEEEEIVAPDYNEISDDVSSEYSIDYRQLRRFLSQKDWQSADDETSMIVNTIINDSADCTNFDSFPLKDLQAIDNLWTKYSLGHYGATAQFLIKRIVEIKMTLAMKTFDIAQFYDLIGHPVYLSNDKSRDKLSHVRGHYPSIFVNYQDNKSTLKYLERVQFYLRIQEHKSN
ncbi:MAG: GUN4 domain-containing protein [Cyanobacteria bacterium P01_C01_bin.121]